MLWKTRYAPVEEERVVPCDQSEAVCRALLQRWCVQTRERVPEPDSGLVVKPFGKEEFRVHFPYEPPAERNYYYKHYFLRVWLTARPDGGCDIHFQRVFDRFTGRMCRPLGAILTVTAVLWLIIMRNTTQAWVYVLSLFMVWAGVLLMLPTIEKAEQGSHVSEALEQALQAVDWSAE